MSDQPTVCPYHHYRACGVCLCCGEYLHPDDPRNGDQGNDKEELQQ